MEKLSHSKDSIIRAIEYVSSFDAGLACRFKGVAEEDIEQYKQMLPGEYMRYLIPSEYDVFLELMGLENGLLNVDGNDFSLNNLLSFYENADPEDTETGIVIGVESRRQSDRL